MRGSGRATERLVVYVPLELKRQVLDLVDREGGSLSAFVLSLIREAVRQDRWHADLKAALEKKAGTPATPRAAPPAAPPGGSSNAWPPGRVP